MNLKCCWTDTIVIVYLIMYNIYITITIIYVIFWMYRHKPLSLYLQLQLKEELTWAIDKQLRVISTIMLFKNQ